MATYLAYKAWLASPTDGPALLYFRSDSCAYCKEMTPVVDEIRHKYGRQVDVAYVNMDHDDGKRLAREYGVIGTPTVLLLDSAGVQVNVLRGTLPTPVIEQAVKDLVAQ
ncbi:MAG: thioredoxin family protein [Anaerolineae bacterium]